ncbi:hypothetical protein C3489_21735 [Streptomyces sp. Ru71]|uniref:hypothetical protein n=1 Tax=Streptomyces sp. Ru71 TaxID=2080746 RepID=UPI000CDD8326|nr:hypothetical protein [Streptomyces sp. Ru71]POX50694.1 hypothetical protein C3489_21735 [Streptomyces sp. Ru71]
MTLEAIVFLAIAVVVGHLVHRREGVGAGMAAGIAVLGVLCLLSGLDPAPPAVAPPATPQQTVSHSPTSPGA